MIERFVDFIQASLWLSESEVIMRGFQPLPPVRFYKRGYQMPNGFRIYFGNPNSKKAMAVASGQTMQSLRNDRWQDASVIGWLLTAGGEISRLDLAVTEWIEDDLVTLEDVAKWVSEGLVEARGLSGQAKIISSLAFGGQRDLETLYVGDMKKRGKQGIFRAYDKGLELNIGSYLSTRLELELKREKAHNVAKRLADSNDVAGNFRTHFNVKSPDFERLMEAPAVPAVRGKNLVKEDEKEARARRWEWLLKQVAPALAQAIKDDEIEPSANPHVIDFLISSGLAPKMQWKRRQIVNTLDLD